MDSLRDFFFTIIPGYIIIQGLSLLSSGHFLLEKDNQLFILGLSLLAGFITDNIYTFFRNKCKVDEFIYYHIADQEPNVEKLFVAGQTKIRERFKDTLSANIELSSPENDETFKLSDTLHFMDQYASGRGYSLHILYATTRASFWGNMTVGSVLLLVYSLIRSTNYFVTPNTVAFCFFTLLISLICFFQQRLRLISSIIKSFSVSFEEKKKPKRNNYKN